jgi:predicted 2-oxoglutarate/Fe(II)-dependent dioxygenase YbiX
LKEHKQKELKEQENKEDSLRDFKVLELSNCLTEDECNHLVQFHKTHQHLVTFNDPAQHYNGRRIPLENIKTYEVRRAIRKAQYVAISNIFASYKDQVFPEQAEIMRWKVGMDQKPHIDKMAGLDGDKVIDVYPETAWAAIVYLNDSYEGGRTFFESCPELPLGYEIKPERGKIVMFEGMEFYHGVTKVRRAERYTIAMWFTRNWKTMAPDLRI